MATQTSVSLKTPAIRSALNEAFSRLLSRPAISKIPTPVAAFLGLTSAMSRSESLISLLTTDIARLYLKPEPSFTMSDTAAHRGGRENPSSFILNFVPSSYYLSWLPARRHFSLCGAVLEAGRLPRRKSLRLISRNPRSQR
jgi:hypothetical protein